MSIIATMTGSAFVPRTMGIGLGFPALILLFLALWGGCAGSASGGLKIFRVRAMVYVVWIQIGALLRPHTILSAKVDDRVLDRATRQKIMGYVFIYCALFGVLAWCLGALGLDSDTTLSVTVSAIANSSYNLGHSVVYAGLPDAAKILLSVGMLLGRLEILPVLALFTKSFWRR